MVEATPCPAFRSFRCCCEQGHTWDASLAIRTAVLGTFSFETGPSQITERQRQLLDDAKELVQMHEQRQQTHCNFEVPDEISDGFLQWVTGLTDDDLNLLYRYDSTLDVVRQPAELIPCPQCGRIFKGTKRTRHSLSEQTWYPGTDGRHSRSDVSEVPENILNSQQHDHRRIPAVINSTNNTA